MWLWDCNRNTRFLPVVISSNFTIKRWSVDAANLFNDLDLSIESCGSTLDQWHTGCKTHPVDMTPSSQVIQRVENNVECLEPIHVELTVHDVRMVGLQLCAGLEIMRDFFRNLWTVIAVSAHRSVVRSKALAQSG